MAEYDLIVIGSGPGGYVAAIRAAQLGMKTAIVEKSDIGGVCLNWGCIPSKALIRNAEIINLLGRADEFGIELSGIKYDFGKAIDRSRKVVTKLTKGVEFLLKKNKVDCFQDAAILESPNTVKLVNSNEKLIGKNIILATGARPRNIPGLDIDYKTIITSREALEFKDVPDSVVIIGGGAVGVEFGYVYSQYGAQVTIVELESRIVPTEDEEISGYLQKSLEKHGIKVKTNTRFESVKIENGEAIVSVKANEQTETIKSGRVLVAVGMTGNVEGLGLESIGIDINKGYINVDSNMATNVSGVYAIGDVTGKMLLAHVASAQGVYVVETIAGLSPPGLDYDLMPRAIYCHPQVASFGLTENQAREKGYELKVGRFPLSASGKAIAMGETEGMVKVVAEKEIGDILGVHMIGSEVTELLGEIGMARMLESTTEELGWLTHPHPTISEVIKEAALDAQGGAVHI